MRWICAEEKGRCGAGWALFAAGNSLSPLKWPRRTRNVGKKKGEVVNGGLDFCNPTILQLACLNYSRSHFHWHTLNRRLKYPKRGRGNDLFAFSWHFGVGGGVHLLVLRLGVEGGEGGGGGGGDDEERDRCQTHSYERPPRASERRQAGRVRGTNDDNDDHAREGPREEEEEQQHAPKASTKKSHIVEASICPQDSF